MPAERPRQSHNAHLTWAAVPLEPASPQSIAFAPNVTPVTFHDPPSRTTTHFEPVLFPSADCSARRPTHGKKRGEDHIPRPPNAFILFRSSFIKSQHVSTEVETNHSTLSKIIGLTWQNMPDDERQVWHEKAKFALEEHKKKWPQYAFRPSHSKAKRGTEKRRVREVEPKDLKRCAKIAELLVEGKKGADLDAAIQEFDRTHVPEVVTRFETPITAGSYRRSSSAPVDESQDKKTSPSPSSRRVRSASSQPVARPVGESRGPAPLVSSQSCPDLSAPTSFAPSCEYSFPSRSQPSFDLDPFAFDVAFGDSILQTSAELGSYPVTGGRMEPPPTLCIDTNYRTDWTPSSSPFSSTPATPQLLSASPFFECASLDADDPFTLNPFAVAAASDRMLPTPCGGSHYAAGLHVLDSEQLHQQQHPSFADTLFTQSDFAAAFQKDPFGFGCCPESAKPTTVTPGADLSLSAFWSSLPAF